MSRIIFLRDREFDISVSGWRQALESTFPQYKIESSSDIFCLKTDSIFQCSGPVLLFLHTQKHREKWIAYFEQGRINGDLVLIRSQGGPSAYRGTCSRIHECIWDPKEFTSRPEPQRFATRIAQKFPPDWALLDRTHFPSNLIACCWLLAFPEYENVLQSLWPVACLEVARLRPSSALAELPPIGRRTESHDAIRSLLNTTWQTWAPYSPVIIVRRRLSHEWLDKRTMYDNQCKLAEDNLNDLQVLIDGIEKAFRPSQYYPLLRDSLKNIPLSQVECFLAHIDTLATVNFALPVVKAELSGHVNQLKTLLTSSQPNLNILANITDAICISLNKLPKEVPQP